jgi:hypothetical protein
VLAFAELLRLDRGGAFALGGGVSPGLELRHLLRACPQPLFEGARLLGQLLLARAELLGAAAGLTVTPGELRRPELELFGRLRLGLLGLFEAVPCRLCLGHALLEAPLACRQTLLPRLECLEPVGERRLSIAERGVAVVESLLALAGSPAELALAPLQLLVDLLHACGESRRRLTLAPLELLVQRLLPFCKLRGQLPLAPVELLLALRDSRGGLTVAPLELFADLLLALAKRGCGLTLAPLELVGELLLALLECSDPRRSLALLLDEALRQLSFALVEFDRRHSNSLLDRGALGLERPLTLVESFVALTRTGFLVPLVLRHCFRPLPELSRLALEPLLQRLDLTLSVV